MRTAGRTVRQHGGVAERRRVRADRSDPKGASRSGGPSAPAQAAAREGHSWTLLTSHGRVLLLIARNPDLKVREIAEQARITERAASGITADLEAAGYLTKQRQGRRTTYLLHPDATFRHPAESGHRVSELIDVFVS
jgi:hypothetical protein